MGIEGIIGAGMTYQGSSSTAEIKAESIQKVEAASNAIASEEIAKETSKVNTKNVSADGSGQDEGGKQAAQNSQIRKAVEDINKKAQDREAVFGIHDATNRVTIKIVDRKTKKVIKEFPPEKTLDMIAKAWEMAGIMVDEKR